MIKDHNDFNDIDDGIIEEQLKEALDYFDNSVDVNIPHLSTFRKMVSTVEEKKLRKRNKEFAFFSIIALSLCSAFTFAYTKHINVFIIVQIISFLFMPIALLSCKYHHRQVRS